MKILKPFLLGITFLLMFPPSTFAISDPLGTKNNIFGIHIIDENDLEDAAKLVNGNGGEWGYVTFVIREDDKDINKWRRIFDRMRELKLIPIVRIATRPEGAMWVKPEIESAQDWATFLDSLNWVVANRYVILFNEPNHSNEWGGLLNPEEYAKIARKYQDLLKAASEDFFVLPAGFDVSAPNSKTSMDVANYFSRMYASDPEIFKLFDGWTSHSYPNPGFSSTPAKNGRGSIKSFEWETTFLEKYGLKRGIPVFITETGWIHKEGKDSKVLGYSSETVGNFYQTSFESVWRNSRVVAVTPFVLNYQGAPFDRFSWKKLGSSEFYPQYGIVQSIPKEKGKPEQAENSIFVESDIPDTLVSDSTYSFYAIFKNTGQSIWENYFLDLGKFGKSGVVPKTKPQEDVKIELNINTPQEPGVYKIDLQLNNNEKKFGQSREIAFKVISPVAVIIKGQGFAGDSSNFYFDVIDGNQIIESMEIGLPETDAELKNVVVGKEYKFGLSKLYYPTKFKITRVSEKDNVVDFGRLWPIDLNSDGQFSVRDIAEALLHPLKTLKIFNIQ